MEPSLLARPNLALSMGVPLRLPTKLDGTAKARGSNWIVGSPKDRSIDRGFSPLDDIWIKNQSIVTLQTRDEKNDCPKGSENSICRDKLTPLGNQSVLSEIGNNDVVVMAQYMTDNFAGLVISYNKVCDIALSESSQPLLLQKLDADRLKNKLYIETKGVIATTTPLKSNTKLPLVGESDDLIEIQIEGTEVFVSSNEGSQLTEGVFTFCSVRNGKIAKKYFEVEVNLYRFPIKICKFFSFPHLVKSEAGYQIVKQKTDGFTANASSEKDLTELFTMEYHKNVLFKELLIGLGDTNITKEKIDAWKRLRLQISFLRLQLQTPYSRQLALALLMKFPLCKNVRLEDVTTPHINNEIHAEVSVKTVEPPLWSPRLEDNLVHFLKNCHKLHHLNKLELFNVDLQLTSLEKMKRLREGFQVFSSNRDAFQLTIESISDLSSLSFIILLTSHEKQNEDIITKSRNGMYFIQPGAKTNLIFSKGKLKEVYIAMTVICTSYQDTRDLCLGWKLPDLDVVQCERIFMFLGDLNFTWYFQLQNFVHFDYLQVFEAMEAFRFTRESLIDANHLLWGIPLNKNPIKTVLCIITIKISLEDSRSEIDNLITLFRERIGKLGIDVMCFTLDVDVDSTFWSYVRFSLTQEEYVVNMGKVTIFFPGLSTEKVRSIAIETHTIPSEIIKQINGSKNTEFFDLSPIVCIDQTEDIPFQKDVNIYFDYPPVKRKLYTRTFSKHTDVSDKWQPTENSRIILFTYRRRLLYRSKVFSPVVNAFQSGGDPPNPTEYIEAYFAKCAFVIIHPLVHKLGNVVFDCVEEKNESNPKYSKVSPYFQMRKIDKMDGNQKLFAKLGGNLTVDWPKLKNNGRMQFFCPYHLSNEQEYKLKKIQTRGDWCGYVEYFMKSKTGEQRLFHMCYELPREAPKRESSYDSSLLSQNPDVQDTG